MSQRGGSVVTYVKYGEKVYSPIIDKGEADIILAFETLEAYRALPYLKKGGKMIVNNQRIDPMPVITGAMEYPENIPENVVVWAQAMLSDEAIDITERVTVDNNRLTIDGKDLRWFSKVTHDETETYEPSLIITIARN